MELRPLDYTVLVVEDLDRALHFYVDLLGLAVSHRTEDFAQLFTGHTRLSFTTRPALSAWLGRPLAAPDPEAPAFELGFKVEDVDDTLTSLTERGVPVEVPATDRPWGQRCATRTGTWWS